MTDIRISVVERKAASELDRLRDWLSQEDTLRGLVRSPAMSIPDGAMGVLSDSFVVAVGSGGILTVLVSSIANWLSARSAANPAAGPTIEIEFPDGLTIRVNPTGGVTEEQLRAATEAVSDEG